ncbi:MAG: NAD(P)-dependent oxidoreductase [Albidovulum sp.]
MSQSFQRDIGRVLVVGGSGRLGQLLRRAWAHLGQDGLIWQHRREGPMIFDPLHEPEKFTAAATGADTILNLAGVTGSDRSALALNTDLALAAVRAAKAASVKRVFLASSAAVYGSTLSGREDDVLDPASAYGMAKLAMERAVLQQVMIAGGPAVTSLRIGNVAGADQLLGIGVGVGDEPQRLHVFKKGHGPARSYCGPLEMARQLAALFAAAKIGQDIPPVLNLSLDGTVRMEALLEADGRPWVGVRAPESLAPVVRLDVTLLRTLTPVGDADAHGIVRDLRTVQPAAGR